MYKQNNFTHNWSTVSERKVDLKVHYGNEFKISRLHLAPFYQKNVAHSQQILSDTKFLIVLSETQELCTGHMNRRKDKMTYTRQKTNENEL